MMKRIAALLVLLPMIIVTSCDDDKDIIWDIAPVCVDVIVQNSDGQNILTPGVPGSLFNRDVTVEYNGEVYPAEWEKSEETRYYMPNFRGLRFMEGYSVIDDSPTPVPSNDYLTFGEFAGDKDQNLSVTLKIEGQPQVYQIEVIHKFEWKKNKPKSTTQRYLNGERVSGNKIIITLPEAK